MTSLIFWKALLVPIVWILLQRFAVRPLNSLAKKYLPSHIADALTKQRG